MGKGLLGFGPEQLEGWSCDLLERGSLWVLLGLRCQLIMDVAMLSNRHLGMEFMA